MSETATAEVKPTAQTEPVAKEGATAEVKPTATAKTKDVTIPCKYAQVRIGTEYFTPDHEGNITVPAELAKEAKKVCGE